MSECAGCRHQGHAGSETLHWLNPPLLNWSCRPMHNGCKMFSCVLYCYIVGDVCSLLAVSSYFALFGRRRWLPWRLGRSAKLRHAARLPGLWLQCVLRPAGGASTGIRCLRTAAHGVSDARSVRTGLCCCSCRRCASTGSPKHWSAMSRLAQSQCKQFAAVTVASGRVPCKRRWVCWVCQPLTHLCMPVCVLPLPSPKSPFAWGMQSNTWFLGPTCVHNPNCISVGSAVFAGLSVMINRHAERPHYISNYRLHLYTACDAVRKDAV